jgi:hypothetical protein
MLLSDGESYLPPPLDGGFSYIESWTDWTLQMWKNSIADGHTVEYKLIHFAFYDFGFEALFAHEGILSQTRSDNGSRIVSILSAVDQCMVLHSRLS